MSQRRIYLDNAATSFPKPQCVHDAMLNFATQIGASSGRGSYAESKRGTDILRSCRQRLADLIEAESPDRIVWTLNTSDALNLAIKGIVLARQRTRPGNPIHLVTTQMDHNSVLRPFNALRHEGITWSCVRVDPQTGIVDPARIADAIRPETTLVAVVHASNVTGSIQPIADIGCLCRSRGVPLLVDAAQSLGHIPVSVRAMQIDLLAFPGHKGLLGPLGTGGLYLRPGMEDLVETVREGGTGSLSEEDTHPSMMPDRYEAGSHNTIGIAGLNAALGWLAERGIDAIRAHEVELIERTLVGLASLTDHGLRLLGPTRIADRVGVFAFTHPEIPPAQLASRLEDECGILVRAGIHCAPRAHKALGTLDTGGATRASFSPFVTVSDVDALLDALAVICTTHAKTIVPAR